MGALNVKDNVTMKHKEYFDRYFDLNPDSPTGIVYKGTDSPAGWKQKERNGYQWVIARKCQTGKGCKQFLWSVPKVIYEITHDVVLNGHQMVTHIDGNKDNLKPDNLKKVPYSLSEKQKLRNIAFNQYQNVVLSRLNPDYFKHPSEWSDPKALEALELEKQKRQRGESRIYQGIGMNRKWI